MYDFNSDSFGSFGIDTFVSSIDQQEGLLGNVIITDDDFGIADKSIAKTVPATQEAPATTVVVQKFQSDVPTTPVVASRSGRGGKTDEAKAIFNEFYNKLSRKDIIVMFVDKVGLTPAGASTYYQNFKKELA